MPNIDAVWERICQHAGETFTQKQGGEFTYTCDGGMVRLDRTNHSISKSHFAKALERMPTDKPSTFQDLRGPSYIWAILTDPRILPELA